MKVNNFKIMVYHVFKLMCTSDYFSQTGNDYFDIIKTEIKKEKKTLICIPYFIIQPIMPKQQKKLLLA